MGDAEGSGWNSYAKLVALRMHDGLADSSVFEGRGVRSSSLQ